MLSSTALFGVSCAIAVCLVIVVPALAVWAPPLASAVFCGLLVGAMPFILRRHQISVILSSTFYVAAAAAVAYLAFGPFSEGGAWEPSQWDLVVLGIGFAAWIGGLATGGICYALTSLPLVLHITLPFAAFALYQVSTFSRPQSQKGGPGKTYQAE